MSRLNARSLLLILLPALLAWEASFAGLMQADDHSSAMSRGIVSHAHWVDQDIFHQATLQQHRELPGLAMGTAGLNALLSSLLTDTDTTALSNLSLYAVIELTHPAQPVGTQTTAAYDYPQRTPLVLKAVTDQEHDQAILFNAFAHNPRQIPGRDSGLIPLSAATALLERRGELIAPVKKIQIALTDSHQYASISQSSAPFSQGGCTAENGSSVALFNLHCSWKE